MSKFKKILYQIVCLSGILFMGMLALGSTVMYKMDAWQMSAMAFLYTTFGVVMLKLIDKIARS